MTTAFPPPLSRKARGTGAQRQGVGLLGRGKTPELLIERARRLRAGQTEAEDKLWARVRAGRLMGLKFRRQIAFSESYIADFVCPRAKLIVELDGSQHVEQMEYDARRTGFFESQGYRVIRFWNNDVLLNLDSVLEAIYAALTAPLPASQALFRPSPLEGEGRNSAGPNPPPHGGRDSLHSKQGEGP